MMDLGKMAECSQNEPVKKDLLKTAGSNIVVVCLEAGQEIAPHPEPYAVVFVVLQGKGFITAGSVRHTVQPFHLVSVRKDENRGIRCDQRMLILGIRDDVGLEDQDA